MAGMPPDLINRANEILQQLEEKHVDAPYDETIEKSARLDNKIKKTFCTANAAVHL
jgi:DNA mismatch repair protein MutS